LANLVDLYNKVEDKKKTSNERKKNLDGLLERQRTDANILQIKADYDIICRQLEQIESVIKLAAIRVEEKKLADEVTEMEAERAALDQSMARSDEMHHIIERLRNDFQSSRAKADAVAKGIEKSRSKRDAGLASMDVLVSREDVSEGSILTKRRRRRRGILRGRR